MSGFGQQSGAQLVALEGRRREQYRPEQDADHVVARRPRHTQTTQGVTHGLLPSTVEESPEAVGEFQPRRNAVGNGLCAVPRSRRFLPNATRPPIPSERHGGRSLQAEIAGQPQLPWNRWEESPARPTTLGTLPEWLLGCSEEVDQEVAAKQPPRSSNRIGSTSEEVCQALLPPRDSALRKKILWRGLKGLPIGGPCSAS